MKFIIAHSTIVKSNIAICEITNTISDALDRPHINASDLDIVLCSKYANHSVSLNAGHIVIEINDEALTKCLAVYLKIAKTIAPFIAALCTLTKLLHHDIKDLESFLNIKK